MSAFWSPYQIGLVFGFPNWHLVGIGLVLVLKFSESGITNQYTYHENINGKRTLLEPFSANWIHHLKKRL